ncbi:ATP-binding protein [Paenibacillus sp. 1P03SA]|uniref:ATP-binding protein n=1 Tax=Paenibacillus sp. 1P03SA TaxID=3132294 RepID=UPI0039A11E37
MALIKDLLLQLFFALMPFVLYSFYYRDKDTNYSRKFILITSMICLFLSMTFASSVEKGIQFDVRYVILFFSLVFGGFRIGLLILLEFILYRLYLGGPGIYSAMVLLLVTFPLSVLLCKAYHRTREKYLVALMAGLCYSFFPLLFLYIDRPDYILTHLTYHILIIPVHNSVGVLLLFYLFEKSATDKDLYLKYLQSEKIEAVGQVAASLVHEVRNPLTTVLGFLKLIRQDQAMPAEKLHRFIDTCIEEVKRTEAILSEYLSMSKPLTQKREEIDLTREIEAVVEVMTPYATMNNVSLALHVPSEPVRITANGAEMKQLLVNFVKNAVEACSSVQKGNVSLRMHTDGPLVKVHIRDNGIGMNKEQLRRLGSIYYSTKNTGTGLGLTYSYQLIRSMNGTISVFSQPHGGTEFTLSLPLAAITSHG